MARREVVLSEERGRVAIARPVEDRLRAVAAVVGLVAVFTGLVGLLVWRPSILDFPDSLLALLYALALTVGTIALSFALWGGEWIVSFEAATGTVRQELHTFGNLAAIDAFVFEDLSGLCAVHDREADDVGVWRLFMVEAGDGRPLPIGEFADEASMRAAARAINRVHPGLSVG